MHDHSYNESSLTVIVQCNVQHLNVIRLNGTLRRGLIGLGDKAKHLILGLIPIHNRVCFKQWSLHVLACKTACGWSQVLFAYFIASFMVPSPRYLHQ